MITISKRSAVFFKLGKAQLRVGLLGFGGPLATMSMMRDELVDREKLIESDRYLEGLGAVKLLPGPVSTLLAIFLGQEVAGFWGGLLSGLVYILPSFILLLLIGQTEEWLGPRLLHSPLFTRTMNTVQAAVIGIIVFTCWKLFREASVRLYGGKARPIAVYAFAALAAILAWRQVPELAILVSCAFLGWAYFSRPSREKVLTIHPLTIFLTFFKAGFTVFGTGYMILPYLQRVLVTQNHWLALDDFLKGVAYGNLTPGPIVIASTYLGQKMLGFRGAVLATTGIFAGPFILMLCLGPTLKKFLGRPWVEGMLLGLLPAVAATITVSLFGLAQGVAWNALATVLAVVALGLSIRRWPAWALLGMSALIGFAMAWVG